MKKLLSVIFMLGMFFAFACSLKKETVMVPDTGEVCFRVEPASSEVYIDGKLMGRANEFQKNPNCLELSAGKHLLKISNSGFESYEQEIYVGAQAEQWVSVKLSKEKGK